MSKTHTYSRRLAEAHNRSLRVAQNSLENQYKNLNEVEAAEAYIALEDKVNEVLGNEGTPVPPQQKHMNSVFRALDNGEELSDALEEIPMNKTDKEDPSKYVESQLERNQHYIISHSPIDFTTTGIPQELPDLENEASPDYLS